MTRRLLASLLAFVALAATPAAAQQPRADEPKGPTIPADGTEVLQYLLDLKRIKPVTAQELKNLNRLEDVIVIVLGQSNDWQGGNQSPLEWASHVMYNGGAALVAADTKVDFPRSFTGARARVVGQSPTRIPGTIVTGTARGTLYLGQPNMPFVVPLPRPPVGDGPEWELFDGLTRIATNTPSYIQSPDPRGEFGSQLAGFPNGSFTTEFGRSRNLDPDVEFFALGGSGMNPDSKRRYRFLAIADPSVFINSMMIGSDQEVAPDNLQFAERVIKYLSEEDGRMKRTRCLLIQNGEIVERFDTVRSMMRPPLPLPNIWAMQEKLTDLGNKIIDQFETNDTVNKGFVGSTESERTRRFKFIMEFILAMLCIRAGWYLLKRVWIARRKPDGPSAVAGGLPSTAKGDRPAGFFDRRQRELLRRNNLFEPVRTAIRGMFVEAGVPDDAGKKLPRVVIADAVTRSDTLREALQDLWKIAYGPARVVTVQRWNLLEPIFERVRQAHADGKWRFA